MHNKIKVHQSFHHRNLAVMAAVYVFGHRVSMKPLKHLPHDMYIKSQAIMVKQHNVFFVF